LEKLMKEYTVVVERAEDGSWSAFVPDLPGCTAGGATMKDASTAIRLSIELWLEETLAQGARIPEPQAKSFAVTIS
jgi:predicted RNase H-like HicB family nuclease